MAEQRLNSGFLNKEENGDRIKGTIDVDGEAFTLDAKVMVSKAEKRYFPITATGAFGETLDGVMFEREPGVSAAGKAKPCISGDFKLAKSKAEWQIAIWEHENSRGPYLSAKVQPKESAPA